MADRPLTLADGQRLPEALFDIVASFVDRIRERVSTCQAGGDRCDSVQPVPWLGVSIQSSPACCAVEQQIASAIGWVAAAFDQHRRWPLGMMTAAACSTALASFSSRPLCNRASWRLA